MERSSTALTFFMIVLASFGLFSGSTGSTVEASGVDRYEDVIGRSIRDRNVQEFVAANHCELINHTYICKSEGIALWISDEIVRYAYLYSGNCDGFSTYTNSKPPFGLNLEDTRDGVEKRLGEPQVFYAPPASWQPGKPDRTGTVGHNHYWAIYTGLEIIVVYDIQDSKNDHLAKIHTIIVIGLHDKGDPLKRALFDPSQGYK